MENPMTPEKVLSVIQMYEMWLEARAVPKKRINPKDTFGAVSEKDLLAHAHFLCQGVKDFSLNPGKTGKMYRHLTTIQMCLSFAGWYTLEDLMDHNKP